MTNSKKALILALATIMIWSTIASAFKLSLREFSPAILLFYSSLSSLFILIIISLLKRSPIFQISKKDMLFSSCAGFLNPFLYYLVLLRAYEILPAQSAQALNYTWGITLSILSFIFLGHKPLKRDILSVLICYFGVFIIATNGGLSFEDKSKLSGIILALSSTIIWASYWIINTKDKLLPEIRLFWNFFFGSIYSALYICIFESFKFSVPGFAGSLYIGFFEMGISFFLWLTAMKLTDNASRISNLIYLSPVISLFIIKNIVGEKIMVSTLWGLFFIITGLVVQNYKRDKGL